MKRDGENRKWIYGSIAAMVFLIVVSVLTYLRRIPTEIQVIPYYDSIAHFVLFGGFGFVVEMAFRGAKRRVFGLNVPIGATLVALYATGDEFLQLLSRNRTFEVSDLCMGLLGIVVAYFVSKNILNRRHQDSSGE